MKKYNMFLNILLVILVTIGIGIIVYMAYDYISNYILTKEAEEAVNLFENQLQENIQANSIVVDIGSGENTNTITNTQINNNQTTTSNNNTVSYKGFKIIGSINIPKTNIKYPVVDTITPNAVAVSVTAIYGPGLNEVRKYRFSSTQL